MKRYPRTRKLIRKRNPTQRRKLTQRRKYRGGDNEFVSYKINFKAEASFYTENNNNININNNNEREDLLNDFFEAIGEKDRWNENVQVIMENSFFDKERKDLSVPVKNLTVVLGRPNYPNKSITGTVSWESWVIEKKYIESEAQFRINDRMATYGFEDLNEKNNNDNNEDNKIFVSVSIESTLTTSSNLSSETPLESRRLPRGSTNALMNSAIENKEEMVNFHGEAARNRYYKKSTFNALPEKAHGYKENPFTRAKIMPSNITYYQSSIEGGRRRTVKRTRK